MEQINDDLEANYQKFVSIVRQRAGTSVTSRKSALNWFRCSDQSLFRKCTGDRAKKYNHSMEVSGTLWPVYVSETSYGLGVFARIRVPIHQFICCYKGKHLTSIPTGPQRK